ncbi:MAG: hypothetical protein ACOC0H_07860, partial [Thermodesulfobacteriota bacterium]
MKVSIARKMTGMGILIFGALAAVSFLSLHQLRLVDAAHEEADRSRSCGRFPKAGRAPSKKNTSIRS